MAVGFGSQNCVSAEKVVVTQGFAGNAQKDKVDLDTEALFTASILFGQARYKCHSLQLSSEAEEFHVQSFTGKREKKPQQPKTNDTNILRKTQW